MYKVQLLLNAARERFLKFTLSLDRHRKSQIRNDVIQHCEQLNAKKRIILNNISDQTITRMIKNRIEKMLKNKKIKKNWSEEDVKILIWIVSKYADKMGIQSIERDFTSNDWENIARLIPGATENSCAFKWLSLKKTNLTLCSWSHQESELLSKIIQRNSQTKDYTHFNWKLFSEELYKQNESLHKIFRSPKQCREHWNCFLNPKLKKGPWMLEEDIQLLTMVKNNNLEKKWSEIVDFFEGRTENALKNRFTLIIEKQKKISKSKQELNLIEDCLQRLLEEGRHNTLNSKSTFINEILKDHEQKMEDHQSNSPNVFEIVSSNQAREDNAKMCPSTITSSPSKTENLLKIHFIATHEQFQFLELLRKRTDLKKCCFKNGLFQIEQ